MEYPLKGVLHGYLRHLLFFTAELEYILHLPIACLIQDKGHKKPLEPPPKRWEKKAPGAPLHLMQRTEGVHHDAHRKANTRAFSFNRRSSRACRGDPQRDYSGAQRRHLEARRPNWAHLRIHRRGSAAVDSVAPRESTGNPPVGLEWRHAATARHHPKIK